ncbi:MAG: exodeoxyribonuclease III [Bacteroidia bacterium]|nr:exodeoxyribonuclease III [Bacteroidia bacterium]
MKVLTYNVNGIRSAMGKGLIDFLELHQPDVLCLQEIKATPDVVDTAPFEKMGYNLYWYPAQKKGYSGVAIFSKIKAKHVEYGCGHEMFDFEGRVLRADFDDVSVFSCYFPSGTTGELRQDVKMQFLDHFFTYVHEIKSINDNLIICGDYNICHKHIDIHDPVSNKNSSGFLPHEREWMDKWFESGFTDGFRHFNQDAHNYTWWSFRANARNNNKGWRIDYISVSDSLKERLKSSAILHNHFQSDHCGMYVELE